VARGASARFLLHPRWLLSHLLVVLLIVVMVNLGFWQLRRLDERRERNDLIEDRQAAEVVPVDEVLSPGDEDAAVEAARYRAVSARGTYEANATVQVRNRTQDGVPGVWLLTPLRLDDGDRIGVIRGFVPLGDDGQPTEVVPPDDEVTVEGWVARADRLDGTAPRDVEPVLEQADMVPALLLAAESDPAEPADDIWPVPLPDLSEGPHLSYAGQWFLFSTIALVGYPLVLRRVVQRRGREVDDPAVGSSNGQAAASLANSSRQ
jgi:surfeit locus 1 family protein